MSDFDDPEQGPQWDNFDTSAERIQMLVEKYQQRGYLRLSFDLTGGDTLRVDLPEVLIEGISLRDGLTLQGIVTADLGGMLVEYDTGYDDINLQGKTITPGVWRDLDHSKELGYFPGVLSPTYTFGYHITNEGRANAQNLGVPYSHLEINGQVFTKLAE